MQRNKTRLLLLLGLGTLGWTGCTGAVDQAPPARAQAPVTYASEVARTSSSSSPVWEFEGIGSNGAPIKKTKPVWEFEGIGSDGAPIKKTKPVWEFEGIGSNGAPIANEHANEFAGLGSNGAPIANEHANEFAGLGSNGAPLVASAPRPKRKPFVRYAPKPKRKPTAPPLPKRKPAVPAILGQPVQTNEASLPLMDHISRDIEAANTWAGGA